MTALKNMKPGDMIEWVYKHNKNEVTENEKLWSSTMRNWIPIGGEPALLISVTGDGEFVDLAYMWLSKKGLFSAYADNVDTFAGSMCTAEVRIVLSS